MDEYVGTLVENGNKNLTNVHLYTGDVLLVKKELVSLLKEVNKKRAAIKRDGFFKKSN